MSNQLGYQPHIDGMRALAVVSVLLFHLDLEGFSGGFVGVDIFFVISGFLITRLIKMELDATGTFSFREFYIRRVRRLLPAYLSTLIITGLFAALMFSPAHLERFGGALFAAVVSLSNVYFWLEADYFDLSAKIKPLLHTWTLGIEEQFYLVWPAVLVLLFKSGLNKSVPLILLATSIVSLLLNVVFGDGEVGWISSYLPGDVATLISNGKSTIFFLLPFRLFEFAIGALLVWFVHYQTSNRFINELVFSVGIMMIAYAIVYFDDAMLFPSYYGLIPVLGTALVIHVGDKVCAAAILQSRVFVGVGLLSYSLYLVHWPIIVFWQYLQQPEQLTVIDRLAVLVMSFVAAVISYRLIEKPFRRKGFSIGIQKGKVAVTLCTGLMAVGFHMKWSGGWPRSVPYTVNFDNVGSASNFHRKYYGGAGYPSYGAVEEGGAPDIILIGDSHGKQYADGIYKELAEPNGLSLYMAAGRSCLHLPNFTRKTQGKNWDRLCPEALNQAIAFVKMAKKPPLVIVSHSWITQMSRADKLNSVAERQGVDIGVDDLIQGLNELKAMIGLSELIVIGSVPGSNGDNLYDIFTRPKFVLSSDFELDDYITSKPSQTILDFNMALLFIGKDSEGITYLNPMDVFCEAGSCINLDEEKHLIYTDATHLSTYGAQLFVRRTLPTFKALLEKR